MPYASNNKLSKTFKDGWVQVSNEFYKELLFIQLGKHQTYKGFSIENGNLVKIERVEKTPPVIDYNDSVKKAKAKIDRAAGAVRLRYITDVPGQQAVYMQKLEQANLFIADNLVADNSIPYIIAEAEARNITKLAAAQLIIGIADFWNITVAPKIEGIRIKYKADLDNLTGEALATAPQVYQDAITALDQIIITYPP
jgi:hypothetical protein